VRSDSIEVFTSNHAVEGKPQWEGHIPSGHPQRLRRNRK
jgi:hypothetical protein